MSSSTGSRMIRLKSSDNEIFEVEEPIAKQSRIISSFLEDYPDSDDVLIPLPKVDEKTLRMVIEWWTKHGDEKVSKKDLRVWEREFVQLDQPTLYDLVMAANYLEVNALLDRLCKRIADMIRGKQPEEIREIFNIKNDFTPEEEAEIRKQNAWAFEDPPRE